MGQQLTDQELTEKVQSTLAELYSQVSSLYTGLKNMVPVGGLSMSGRGSPASLEYLKGSEESFKQANEQINDLKKNFYVSSSVLKK